MTTAHHTEIPRPPIDDRCPCGGRYALCTYAIGEACPDTEPYGDGEADVPETRNGYLWLHDNFIEVGCHACDTCGNIQDAWIEDPRDTEADHQREKDRARLAALDAWLEARGLPKDAPVGDWGRSGWIVFDDDGGVRGRVVALGRVDAHFLAHERFREPCDVVHWSDATTEERAEALRIEGEVT